MPQPNSMENFKKLSVFQVTILTAIMAGFANLLVFFLSKLSGIDVFIPQQFGLTQLVPITLGPVILATIIPAFVAGLIFWFLRKFFPKRAMENFWIISMGFLLLSFGGPMELPVPLGNKLILTSMHIVAALFIVGTLYNYDKHTKQ